ncbi:DUF4145 domain-containing protein [uncultured Pedobacter sp.]|uniref:DUF4145 domain-containing protein n=1 Tax=uncultured Pedobacter sp. TaxID=246139 RepID=UPI002602CEC0|nr:DUF4145 domain-containing protein [uncultured Pedobacter sp.]
MSEQKTEGKEPIKTHCFNCSKETNQDILFKDHELEPTEVVWRNEEGDKAQSAWTIVANMWLLSKCRGCEKINFKHILRRSPDEKTDQVFYFPRKPVRKVPDWIIKLPMQYVEVLQEVYLSVNEGLSILSLTGIRTVLDIYIMKKIGDAGTFKQKLSRLVNEGFITNSKAEVVSAAIEAGSASAHRGYKPDTNTLFKVLDIVENLLQSEIVDRDVEHIKKTIPTRRKSI